MGKKKYCIVPLCTNSGVKTPEKLFFNVPMNTAIRKKWIKASRRKRPLSDKSTASCCEDHFDIETDMENYVKYKLVGGNLSLKKDVVPHKFACQKRGPPEPEKPERSAVEKRRRIELINKILNEPIIPATPDDIEEIYVCDAPNTEEKKEADPLQTTETNDNVNNTKENKKISRKVQVCIRNKNHKYTMTEEKYLKSKTKVKKPKPQFKEELLEDAIDLEPEVETPKEIHLKKELLGLERSHRIVCRENNILQKQNGRLKRKNLYLLNIIKGLRSKINSITEGPPF